MTAEQPTVGEVVDGWLEGRPAGTARTYATSAAQWIAWCEQTGTHPLQPTVGECRAYHEHLQVHGKNNTVNTRCRAVRSLITHAMRHGAGPAWNPWDEVRIVSGGTSSTTPYLGADDHTALLERAAARAGAPEVAMVRILGVLGLRVSEAARFRLQDLTEQTVSTPDGKTETAWVYRYRGKHAVEHHAIVDDETMDAIRAAAQGRTSGWLFPSPDVEGQPITDRSARRWVARLCATAGVPRVPPHGLRRSVATRILESTGDLRLAQAVLDHASVTTTARYDRRDDRRAAGLAAVVQATRPRQETP